jgi:hypothetical protein
MCTLHAITTTTSTTDTATVAAAALLKATISSTYIGITTVTIDGVFWLHRTAAAIEVEGGLFIHGAVRGVAQEHSFNGSVERVHET